MMNTGRIHWGAVMRFRVLALVALVAVVSCVPKKETRLAKQASKSADWDLAYELWEQIATDDPTNTNARLEMARARQEAIIHHLGQANQYLERQLLKEAVFEARLVLGLDPANHEAESLLAEATRQQRLVMQEEAKAIAQLEERVQSLPTLRPNTLGPQNLYFPKPVSVSDIYASIGQAYDINIIVDPEIRNSQKISLDLRKLGFLKALDTLMVLNRHFFKVIDDNTLIILKDSKVNRDNYDSKIIRTFYLSNITPQELKPHMRQLNLKEFAENETLNTITVKGTAEQIALAEKIISANDKSLPEVVIEIEVLEVSKNKMRRVGILPVGADLNTPTYRAGLIADPTARTNDDRDQGGIRGIFPDLDSTDILTIVPAIAIDFLKEKGDSKQVANPQVRVTSGNEANISIGQSIPIANTRFTNAQLSGSSSGNNNFGDQALTTFNYQPVGINIKVTPRVHYNREVTLDLTMEISSVLSAGLQPTLGERKVTTTLRLKNGEINVLAGLLTNDERKSLTGIIGLADIPLLGRLFSNDEKVINQTDIIMTIRPLIVRSPTITPEDRAAYEIADLRLASLYAEPTGAPPRKPLQQEVPPSDWEPTQTVEEDPQGAPSVAPATEYQDKQPFGSTNRIQPSSPDQPAEKLDSEEDLEETIPAAIMAFTPNAHSAHMDEVLEYQLFITNVEDLRSGQMVVTFDPSILRVEAVDMGDFFNARGNRPLLTPAWNNETGRISMIISQRQSAEPFAGSGIMATLRFRAIAAGNGSLGFANVELKTSTNGQMLTEGITADYEVTP